MHTNKIIVAALIALAAFPGAARAWDKDRDSANTRVARASNIHAHPVARSHRAPSKHVARATVPNRSQQVGNSCGLLLFLFGCQEGAVGPAITAAELRRIDEEVRHDEERASIRASYGE